MGSASGPLPSGSAQLCTCGVAAAEEQSDHAAGCQGVRLSIYQAGRQANRHAGRATYSQLVRFTHDSVVLTLPPFLYLPLSLSLSLLYLSSIHPPAANPHLPPVAYKQDLPPSGGYAPIRYKRNLPARGPGGLAIFAGVFAICGFGFYRVMQGNLEQR